MICRMLTGPTASGKSDLALRLAEEEGLEIVCMDSMQIYRRMDIGTAKPMPQDRKRVPHHLLDLVEPWEEFSVAEYQKAAEKLICEMELENRKPLFVGGTGLYLQVLLHPMALGNAPADPDLRQRLHAIAEESDGKRRLHEMLWELDPETAERLHENDLRRVIRAIEVTRATGIPFSKHAISAKRNDSRRIWRVAATRMERNVLYGRIDERVPQMVQMGLAEEVESLLREGVPEDAQSMSGIGYKEMIPCLRGKRTLEETVSAIQLSTRHYAKRQMTFLRREPAIHYFDVPAPEAFDRIRHYLMNGENENGSNPETDQ